MIKDSTIDQALIECARTMKALRELRAKRVKLRGEQYADLYTAPKLSGEVSAEDVRAALSAPFKSPYRLLAKEHAAAKRASLDLTRKMADLRAGR